MLVAALACPHPPLLLPGLGGGADPLARLRAAILDGLKDLAAAEPETLVLVGDADRTARWDLAMPRCGARFAAKRVAFGLADLSGPALPLSLSVGQELLDAAGWPGPRELVSVAETASFDECQALGWELADTRRRAALLVLGDGSARRGEKAPGYLDPRAADYDDLVLRGLSGDLAALRHLDPVLGMELLVAGRAPWQVLAVAAAAEAPMASSVPVGARQPGDRAARAPRARIRYADDPFGVYYVVSSWEMA